MRLGLGQRVKVGDRVVFGAGLRAHQAQLGWLVDEGCVFTVVRFDTSPEYDIYVVCESAPGYDGTTALISVLSSWWYDLYLEWDGLTLAEKERAVNDQDGWRKRRDANLTKMFRPPLSRPRVVRMGGG